MPNDTDRRQLHADTTASSSTRRFAEPIIGGCYSVVAATLSAADDWVAAIGRTLEAGPRLAEIMQLISERQAITFACPAPVLGLQLGDRLSLASDFAVGGSGSDEARTRQLVGRKMSQVWALTDGWRGPGTLAPTRVARDYYLSVVQVLPGRLLGAAQPTPTVDGGLHMEWTHGDRDFSAEITNDGELILTVLAPNDDDDLERVIEKPKTEDLADFISNGA